MIVGAFVLITSLLCVMIFLLLARNSPLFPADTTVNTLELRDTSPHNNDALPSPPKDLPVIEREIVVPASYLVVDGRNYTADDISDILEATGSHLPSFKKWLDYLFNSAEGGLSLLFNGEIYGSHEYFIRNVEPQNCFIEFNHDQFDEGSVTCSNVYIETEDGYDISCDIQLFFEKNTRYEYGKIRNCVSIAALSFTS